jgi:hypothetical protein
MNLDRADPVTEVPGPGPRWTVMAPAGSRAVGNPEGHTQSLLGKSLAPLGRGVGMRGQAFKLSS